MLKHSAFTPTRSGPKEETMSTEQEQWATQTPEIPAVFRRALLRDDDAIRHRPAAGAWVSGRSGRPHDRYNADLDESGGASHGRGAACIATIRSRCVGT